MKKILLLPLMAILMSFCFSSCGNDDEPSGASLVGTSWVNNLYDNKYLLFEFTSASKVEAFIVDSYGNHLYSRGSGSYKFDGRNVTFSNFVLTSATHENYTHAEVAGSSMKAYYWYEMNGTKHEGSSLFRKNE